MADFDKKLTESDAYLQLLIEQTNMLEKHMTTTEDEDDRQRCQEVINNINNVLESIKHTIVLLQVRIQQCDYYYFSFYSPDTMMSRYISVCVDIHQIFRICFLMQIALNFCFQNYLLNENLF